jgi:uncharacterized membrane protein YphA (DoxX/SURF4 family)
MLLRRVARPLLAGIFIAGGIAALRDPKNHAQQVAPALEPVVDKVAGMSPLEQAPSTTTLVKVDAGVKIGAGVLLATGKAPRLAASALAATVVPTTVFGHRFWEITDPDQRANEQAHFLKNLALLGGLLLAAADTEGKPSLAWRAKRAGKTSQATAELFHKDVTDGLGELSRRAGETAGRVSAQAADAANKYGAQAGELAGKYGSQAQDLAAKYGPQAQELAGKYGAQAQELAAKYGPQAQELAGRYGDKAQGLAAKYGPQAQELAAKAGDKLSDRAERARADAERLSKRAAKRAEKAGKRARKAGKRAQKAGQRSRRKARVKV